MVARTGSNLHAVRRAACIACMHACNNRHKPSYQCVIILWPSPAQARGSRMDAGLKSATMRSWRVFHTHDTTHKKTVVQTNTRPIGGGLFGPRNSAKLGSRHQHYNAPCSRQDGSPGRQSCGAHAARARMQCETRACPKAKHCAEQSCFAAASTTHCPPKPRGSRPASNGEHARALINDSPPGRQVRVVFVSSACSHVWRGAAACPRAAQCTQQARAGCTSRIRCSTVWYGTAPEAIPVCCCARVATAARDGPQVGCAALCWTFTACLRWPGQAATG